MDTSESFEYKPGVKDKVSQLESRLGGKSTEIGTKRAVYQRISKSSNDELEKTFQQEITANPAKIVSMEQEEKTTPEAKPSPEQIVPNVNVKETKGQSEKPLPQQAPEEPTFPQVPTAAPRRKIAVLQAIEHIDDRDNDSPVTSSSGNSTRRSSADDGIADMASESDPFDDSSMPLPKIKDNAFMLKDRRVSGAGCSTSGAEGSIHAQISPRLSLRRGSLNPQISMEEQRDKPKPSRTRTDSTNSAENFVVRQICAEGYNNRRESQAEVTIDVIQSKGSQQTDEGLRSPVVVRSKTLSNTAASILVIGLPEAGKSKTIDSLVQKQVTPLESPTDPEIVEYTAKIKILDSSTLFSLKIVDTPGFTNDPLILPDAQLMTTLSNYISSKDGLRGKAPTIVLVVIRFDDKRLWNPEDEHPDIVNFLKLIHHYQPHLNDGKHANFVFVLTHFKSGKLSEQELKKPQSKIVELTNLIQKYTSLPHPIMVVCADNGDDVKNHNGSTSGVTLPNGETFPFNLIEKIKVLLTKKGRDSVGETVLRTAFGIEYPYSIKECEATQRIKLMSESHPDVRQTRKEIQHAYLDIERTEIFTLLEIGWENIDLKIRQKYPDSLFTVQQIFQTKKVCNFADIPEDPSRILNLVRQMPSNLAVKDLLIDTLQLKVPACYPALYIGQGFDLIRDATTNVSPFLFSAGLKTSPVGQIPNEFECKIRDDREICFKFFNEVEDYVLERLKDLKLRYSISPNSLSALSTAASASLSTGQRWGYNLFRKNQEPTKSSIATAIIEHRIFQMTLNPQPCLQFKPQFWDAVQEIPDLDIKDPASVTAWQDFFGYWGTHLVKSAYGGGSVEITFRGGILTKIYNSMKKDFIGTSSEGYETSRVFQWITGDGLDFVAFCAKDGKSDFLKGHDVQANFHGGDIKFQQVDLTKLESKEEVANIREDWKESLALNPVMLETNLVLVPLSYYVREKSEGIATKIDVALHYFYSDFMITKGKQSSCNIL